MAKMRGGNGGAGMRFGWDVRQAQESLFLEELWRAAMEGALFIVDGEGVPCYNGRTRIGPQTAALAAGLF